MTARLRRGPAVLILVTLALAGCSSSHRNDSAVPTVTAPTTIASASTTFPATPVSVAAWTTYDGTASRSGVDRTSPPAGNVRLAWATPVLDGSVYAQPLFVGDTVIVATENDTVYAFDSSTGQKRWSRHLDTPVAGSALPCGNVDPSGITGTPVADVARNTLWVVTFSLPGTHTLWGLDLATGAVTSERPADPPGANPLNQQERGALALSSSTVYIPYGGLYGDCADYHGWVVGLSVATPSDGARSTFETSTERQAGIWSPGGPVVATDGSIYVTTGNGTPVNAVDDSDSVVRLSPRLTVEGTFTPADFEHLSATDGDLGSTSPVLLPGGLVFQIGKSGIGYLLSAASLGGVGGQLASGPVCPGAIGGAVADGDVVVVSCYDGLAAVRVSTSPGQRPRLEALWSATDSRTGPPVIAGGYVWALGLDGALRGYQEATGAVVYRFPAPVAGSFPSPAVAGGWLYAPSADRVQAFEGV